MQQQSKVAGFLEAVLGNAVDRFLDDHLAPYESRDEELRGLVGHGATRSRTCWSPTRRVRVGARDACPLRLPTG
jgi:hypothetical protein